MRYSMPAASVNDPHTTTLEIHKSRFTGWCAGIDGIDDAERLTALARQYYPDASHHCSAYIAGRPARLRLSAFPTTASLAERLDGQCTECSKAAASSESAASSSVISAASSIKPEAL